MNPAGALSYFGRAAAAGIKEAYEAELRASIGGKQKSYYSYIVYFPCRICRSTALRKCLQLYDALFNFHGALQLSWHGHGQI